MAKFYIYETATVERCSSVEADDLDHAIEVWRVTGGDPEWDEASVYPSDWEYSDHEEAEDDE